MSPKTPSHDPERIYGTTILAVRRSGRVAVGGDGQVTLGQSVMKGNARKVRRLYGGKVLAGFAGGTADAFTLFERFEGKLEKFGNLTRAAIELAKDWRSDRSLRRLEALLCVADTESTYVISGNGDVIEPEHDLIAIGSGGGFRAGGGHRLAAGHRAARARRGRALPEHRRRHLHLHQPQSDHRRAVAPHDADDSARNRRRAGQAHRGAKGGQTRRGPSPCAIAGGASRCPPRCAPRSPRRTSS